MELADGARLEEVFEHYSRRFPRMNELRSSIVVALNQQFANGKATLTDGDEAAFLPPVSGGSTDFTHEILDDAGHFFGLTRFPVNTVALNKRLLAGTDGAVVDFQGVVRNNTKGRPTRYLEYECYEAMAVKMMAQIGLEIAGSHAIGRIGMVHRLGKMEIGETSVAIVVTAPHRKPAFDAALEGINRLKRLVPIWKKEFFEDGEVWVEGEWDDAVLKAR